ncbi:hypothetical protein PILCRDRAFT_451331 [Piloderma croceum F 1598]|uniref:Uncharacterized protein n=1 Tax=Piloderma croceum (strain F 1598) TaxID=765440 RepID=A0A0C3FF98_PILCF|nr:hypothetical protein PILCRDRAFT_451331 [Piloderma croceum F 1598]
MLTRGNRTSLDSVVRPSLCRPPPPGHSGDLDCALTTSFNIFNCALTLNDHLSTQVLPLTEHTCLQSLRIDARGNDTNFRLPPSSCSCTFAICRCVNTIHTVTNRFVADSIVLPSLIPSSSHSPAGASGGRFNPHP